MSDDLESLLTRCKAGDEHAVSELVRRHRPWALTAASGIVHDAGLAEDVVQEAFVAALQRLDSLRSPQAFRAWFRRIIRTHAMRTLRKRGEESLDDDNAVPHGGPSPGQMLERADTAAGAIQRILDVYPADMQELSRKALAKSLRVVSSQRLLPKAGGKGRVAAFDVITPNEAIRGAIATGQPLLSDDAPLPEGCLRMTDHIKELESNGTIAPQVAERALADIRAGL